MRCLNTACSIAKTRLSLHPFDIYSSALRQNTVFTRKRFFQLVDVTLRCDTRMIRLGVSVTVCKLLSSLYLLPAMTIYNNTVR